MDLSSAADGKKVPSRAFPPKPLKMVATHREPAYPGFTNNRPTH